jgi:hypothetical protein
MVVAQTISYTVKLRALERKYKRRDLGRNERLTALAKDLGAQLDPPRTWTDKALYGVLAGHKPGRFLAAAIDRMHDERKPRSRRSEKYRVFVPCPDAETLALINRSIPAAERYLALALLADHEED